ncbi:Wzz/FepE/Etk N-terminal domain-containing protein [Dictyobacter formicarum]|uniref:non-specific protein-tyrosine kinase n=1 Tax=Dictyobacter formicarum TaxID=2778368 RepID=A0ABQ3VA83_9CHLR|nr:Wzz/FepE/Etk N-terminal domain-containing protein [Dictyobacter formicarum]GHO82744.1 hypothetical protein KSZ_07500 [Dictyobacter formicarum]
MTLERSLVILTKQWKLIIACMVCVGLGAYITSHLATPIYQSSVLIRVVIQSTSTSSDYNNLLASDQLVQTESQLATSDPVLRKTASHYPGLSVEQLARATTAIPRLNTQLFDITVKNMNPYRAAELANTIAESLIEQQVQENQQDHHHSQQQIQKEVDTTSATIDKTSRKLLHLQQQLATLGNNSPSQAMSLQMQITSLQDQLNRLQEHYSQWQTMLLQLNMNQAQNSDFLRIAQPAQPASHPVQPQILLNTLAGIAAGLSLGLLFAVLIEQFDTRVRTTEDIASILEYPALGTIWRVDTTKGKQESVVNPKINSASAEAYRMLRTNIGFSAVNKPLHSLVVTSAMPNDGKSTIAANLAIFMARVGKKTLLVDADLHHPTQHDKFLIAARTKGLSDAIVACSHYQLPALPSSSPSEHSSLSLETYVYSVDIPNLHIMPAGTLPPNPSELLDSKAMNHFLTILTHSGFEMVIFDTPPLLGLVDANILTAKVDGTLIVADITRVKKKYLQRAKTQLMQSGARILGYVVNKQQYNHHDAPYAYYYNHDADEDQEAIQLQNEHSSTTSASSPPLTQIGQKITQNNASPNGK